VQEEDELRRDVAVVAALATEVATRNIRPEPRAKEGKRERKRERE